MADSALMTPFTTDDAIHHSCWRAIENRAATPLPPVQKEFISASSGWHMDSSTLGDTTTGRRFVSVGLRMAGIILVAVFLQIYVAMTVVRVPFLAPEYTPPVVDLLRSFLRLLGVALAVVYGVTALR